VQPFVCAQEGLLRSIFGLTVVIQKTQPDADDVI
jgi:hypothetical protein